MKEPYVTSAPAVPEAMNGPIACPPPSDAVPGEAVDRRVQRISAYLDQALAQTDGLAANVGAANADLMFLEYRLCQTLKASLAEAPPSVEEYDELTPMIDGFLRVTKQIDRLAQLSSRLQAAQRQGQERKEKARVMMDQGEKQEVGYHGPSEHLPT